MNRKPFVAGNWKMYMTVAEARQLVSGLVPGYVSEICQYVYEVWIEDKADGKQPSGK